MRTIYTAAFSPRIRDWYTISYAPYIILKQKHFCAILCVICVLASKFICLFSVIWAYIVPSALQTELEPMAIFTAKQLSICVFCKRGAIVFFLYSIGTRKYLLNYSI